MKPRAEQKAGRRSGRWIPRIAAWFGRPKPRWRRHGLIRPGIAGIVLLAAGCGLWFMGLLLDDRTLMAASLTVTVIWLLSLLLAIVQWLLIAHVDLDKTSFSSEDRAGMDRAGTDCAGAATAVAGNVAPRRTRRRTGGFTAVPLIYPWTRAGVILRYLLPRRAAVRGQYLRLNQDGAVIGRHVGPPPARRGLYRLDSAFACWHDPFGLFRASRLLRRRDDVVVLPAAEERTTGGTRRIADRRLQGLSVADNTGGVRAYVPGDPMKLISWKASAHRGMLMTRETGRDVRASVIVVLDLRSAFDRPPATDAPDHAGDSPRGGSSTWVDAAVGMVMPLLERENADCRLIVTDGVQVADDAEHIRRLLASAAPIPQDGAQPLAVRIGELAARSHDVAGVRLLTPTPQSPLAEALRGVIGQDRLHVDIVADGQDGVPSDDEQDDDVHDDDARSRGDARHGAVSTATAGRADGTGRAGTARAGHPRDRADITGRILTALCLLTFFALSLHSAAGLVSADGYWIWFLGVGLAIVTVESGLPARSRPRLAARMAAIVAVDVVAAGVVVMIRIHDITGAWLFALGSSAADDAVIGKIAALMSRSGNATEAMFQAARSTAASPWDLLSLVCENGFDALNIQLPPVAVGGTGDVVLVIAAAAIAMIVRCMLVARRVAPAFALLPVTLFAANYALVGRQNDWWRIGLLIAAFLISLWAVRPQRAFAPTPVIASAAVTALVLATTPAAVGFANAVPLSIGDSAGLLSANTINPMVDLKRSLAEGSSAPVLSYRADRRVYLRMTTLDDFDGDTWSFDEGLAKDGGFYGSGIQLGRSDDNTLSGEDRAAYYEDPLYGYLKVLAGGGSVSVAGADGSMLPLSAWQGDTSTSGSDGSDDGTVNYLGDGMDVYRGDAAQDQEYQDALAQFGIEASVSIESLQSRFLPVPGVTGFQWGAAQDWLHAGSTVYSRDSTTVPGMEYSAYGVGLEPITATTDFSRIDGVRTLRQRIEELANVGAMPWSERTALRRDAIQEGRGREYGDWMLMPLTRNDDGTLTDAVGDVVGDAIGATQYAYGGEDTWRQDNDGGVGGVGPVAISRVNLSDAFRESLGISDDEFAMALYADDGAITLALMMSDLASEGTETLTASIGELHDSGNYMATMSLGGASDYRADAAESIISGVDFVNNRVRARYRSLPDGLPAEVTDLVAQAKASGVDVTGSDADAQTAAMRWLVDYFTDPGNGFVYSLDAPDGNGRNNLQVIGDFLESRSGYCTHYASALAVLGRAMGVPTRMVLGYNRGVGAADDDGKYEVAAKQLHAWVEAYIDDVGWVPFDVTPASADNGSAADASDAGDVGATSGADAGMLVQGEDTTVDTGGDADAGTSGGDADTGTDTGTAMPTPDGADDGDAASAETDVRTNVFRLPLWACVTLWTALAIAVVAVLLLTPAGIRTRRRRRRLRAIDAGGAAAWRAAWSELCDSAWDVGVRWASSDTERVIADRIVERLEISDGRISDARGAMPSAGGSSSDDVSSDLSVADDAPTRDDALSGMVVGIAEQVCAVAFGGVTPAVPDDLRRDVESVIGGLSVVGRRSGRPVARALGHLFPASLFTSARSAA